MAWLAVDIDGCEWIFQNKPKQFDGLWEDAIYESFDGQGGKPVFHHYSDIMLPKGTIEKIVGRKISCIESPVELEGNYNY